MAPTTPLDDGQNDDQRIQGVSTGKSHYSKKASAMSNAYQQQQMNQIILGEMAKDFQVEQMSMPELNEKVRCPSPKDKQIQRMWKTQKEFMLKKTGKVAKYSRDQSALKGS